MTVFTEFVNTLYTFLNRCIHTAIFNSNYKNVQTIMIIMLLHEKFLQFDWLRAVVFQLNLKYPHVKITNFLRVVV